MNTPEETRQSKGKVARPDLFNGDRNKLDDWLLQFDIFFKLENDTVEQEDRATLVASYMRGPALKWVQPYLKKYMDANNQEDDIIRMFEDYEWFKAKVR